MKKILLVEDNADDEALTIRALKKAGIENEIVVMRDGVEGLDYLFATGAHQGRDPNDLPGVVFLDLKLPKVDGHEILDKIRSNEKTRSLPVIMLTSSGEDRDVRKSYESGCNSYVRKPVDFDQFSRAVQQLGLYWLQLNEPLPGEGSRPS